MEKFLVLLGIFISIAVFVVNRIMFQLSDMMNILLGVIAAVFIIAGIIMKDMKDMRWEFTSVKIYPRF